jgi:hypothetical protein
MSDPVSNFRYVLVAYFRCTTVVKSGTDFTSVPHSFTFVSSLPFHSISSPSQAATLFSTQSPENPFSLSLRDHFTGTFLWSSSYRYHASHSNVSPTLNHFQPHFILFPYFKPPLRHLLVYFWVASRLTGTSPSGRYQSNFRILKNVVI